MANSPFPGMDPYLESRWDDVHSAILTFLKAAIQQNLPSPLRARTEQRLIIEEEDGEHRTFRPDVLVAEPAGREASGGVATLEAPPENAVEPVRLTAVDAPAKERWLKIIDSGNGNRVITVIEVLSPWNKRAGRGGEEFCEKIERFRQAGVNVVEIDLLRTPRTWLPVPDDDVPPDRREAYRAAVAVGRGGWRVYPISIRKPLPPIPIPLRPGDPHIWTELQPLIDRAYAAGGHDDIDYNKDPAPPLSPDDAAWADALLREAGKRSAPVA